MDTFWLISLNLENGFYLRIRNLKLHVLLQYYTPTTYVAPNLSTTVEGEKGKLKVKFLK